jgi:hypothetical protein
MLNEPRFSQSKMSDADREAGLLGLLSHIVSRIPDHEVEREIDAMDARQLALMENWADQTVCWANGLLASATARRMADEAAKRLDALASEARQAKVEREEERARRAAKKHSRR